MHTDVLTNKSIVSLINKPMELVFLHNILPKNIGTHFDCTEDDIIYQTI